ncbi:MAG: hypothetical protein ABEI99_07650, partial [Halobaculum sp.]
GARTDGADGEALADEREELERRHDLYETHLGGETVLSPEFAAEFAAGIEDHRQLERPIIDQIQSEINDSFDVRLEYTDTLLDQLPSSV